MLAQSSAKGELDFLKSRIEHYIALWHALLETSFRREWGLDSLGVQCCIATSL